MDDCGVLVNEHSWKRAS